MFDIYSCFPAAFDIARRAVGILEGDSRDLSVTGGMSFFGGPGNNYSMHAIATVVDLIRKDRSLKAMVTANGWYLTKHSVGIYAGAPSAHPWENRDDSPMQRFIDAQAMPKPIERASGSLVVEADVSSGMTVPVRRSQGLWSGGLEMAAGPWHILMLGRKNFCTWRSSNWSVVQVMSGMMS